jgi:hypothetical protein
MGEALLATHGWSPKGLQNKPFGVLLLFLVLSLSLSLNVVLGWRIRALEATAQAPPRGGVKVGIHWPVIGALDGEGRKIAIGYDASRPTIVYVLSPKCQWCKRNYRNVRALAEANKDRFRFVGLSTTSDGLTDHLLASPLPFPVFALDPADRRPADLGFLAATPQTLVVDRSGVVEKVWVGAFLDGSPTAESVQSFFGIHLPGATVSAQQ